MMCGTQGEGQTGVSGEKLKIAELLHLYSGDWEKRGYSGKLCVKSELQFELHYKLLNPLREI